MSGRALGKHPSAGEADTRAWEGGDGEADTRARGWGIILC